MHSKTKSFGLLFFYFLILSSVAFWPAFFILFLHPDESARATISHWAFNGGLYTEIWDHKPPFGFQLDYLMSLGNHLYLADHYFLAVLVALGAIAFYRILKNWFSEEVSFLGAALYCLLNGVVNHASNSHERLFLPFFLWALYLAFLSASKNSKKSFIYAFLGGFLIGLAALIKQTAGLMGLLIYLVILFSPKFSKHSTRMGSFFVAVIGGFSATFLSWWASGAAFSDIWQSAYLSNLSYIQLQADGFRWDILSHSLKIFGFEYLSIFLGGLLGLYFFCRDSKFQLYGSLLLFYFVVSSFLCVTSGGRYYQQYYVHLLPLFILGTAYAFERLPKIRYSFVCLAVLSLVTMQVNTLQMHLRDKNKNWDSQIQQVIHEIKEDTVETDRIWVTQGLYSIYVMSDRKPAVSRIFMHAMLGNIDVCLAPKALLKEPSKNLSSYWEEVERLQNSKPRVIFWVKRASNGCADKIQPENFPALQQLLQENYIVKSDGNLGTYFILKPGRL